MAQKIGIMDLRKIVARDTNLPESTVKEVIESTLNNIQDYVADGIKVQLTGFGTFERRYRAARNVRNPSTGEIIVVEAKDVPAFKAGNDFKRVVDVMTS